MPSCYAHRRFGVNVYQGLPNDTKRLIQNHLPLFLIGLHGPDLLFYHKCGLGTEVSSFGSRLHHTEFKEFYANASMVIRNSEDDRQLVYYYGVLCHLFLDSYCHPIVNGEKGAIGVSHGKLEMELERFLMTKDGKNPVTFKAASHIGVSREYADVIAPFYLGVTSDEIFQCLVGMKAALTLTRTGNPVVRKGVCMVCDMTNHQDEVASLLMTKEASRLCKPVLGKLVTAYEDALQPAREAITSYTEYLYRRTDVPDYVTYTFVGR